MRYFLSVFIFASFISANAQWDTVKIEFLPYLRTCLMMKDSTSFTQKVNDTLSISYYKFYIQTLSRDTPYPLKVIYVITYPQDIPADDYKFKKAYWWTLRRSTYTHEGIPIYKHGGNW